MSAQKRQTTDKIPKILSNFIGIIKEKIHFDFFLERLMIVIQTDEIYC